MKKVSLCQILLQVWNIQMDLIQIIYRTNGLLLIRQFLELRIWLVSIMNQLLVSISDLCGSSIFVFSNRRAREIFVCIWEWILWIIFASSNRTEKWSMCLLSWRSGRVLTYLLTCFKARLYLKVAYFLGCLFLCHCSSFWFRWLEDD